MELAVQVQMVEMAVAHPRRNNHIFDRGRPPSPLIRPKHGRGPKQHQAARSSRTAPSSLQRLESARNIAEV